MSFECGICLAEVPKRQCVACNRCVNGTCLKCFRTIATTVHKTDVECPYCKMGFSTSQVESLLTRAQLTTRRIAIRTRMENDYVPITHEYLAEMTSLCSLMDSLFSLYTQIAHVRMQRFQLNHLREPDATATRAELGTIHRLTNNLAQLQLRTTCIINHIARIVNTSRLPEMLVEDCVSNAFEPCSDNTDLSVYAASPELQELLLVGLLLCNRHVVRPNVFQYGMIRISSMRSLHTMEQWVRKLTAQCKTPMLIEEWYREMCTAIQCDRAMHAPIAPIAHIVQCLDRLACKTTAPKDWKAWFTLYRRWRSDAASCGGGGRTGHVANSSTDALNTILVRA
jgi:hypothetical protein